MKKLLALLNTPARAVIAVGLIILIAEFLIMAVIVNMHNTILYDEVMEEIVAGIIAPILLVAIVSPALYILIFRPMRNQQDELEVARRKIEQVFQEWIAALDVIDDPVFLHDKQFRILRCNKAYQQRAGIPFPEIIGQPYYEIFPKTGAPLPCCLRALGKEEKAEEAEELAVGEASYRSRAFSIKDEQGVYLYSVHILEDITERKHQEERTAALLELSTSVETLDEKTLLQQGLDTVQHLTDSRIGFLHFVSEDQKEIELVAWSTDTLAHYCQAAFDRHYPLSAAGIWVDSVLLKQPVTINDYATAPGKKGLPEGHAAVQRFICVPVLEGAQVRMIVGVGNAARNYDEHDVDTVKLFSYDLYHLVQRKRLAEQQAAEYRHIAEINAQLTEANQQLKQAQNQLLQSEKMAAIGNLAAGVAHEINNPIGYVNSNLGTLEKYLADIFAVLNKYETVETLLDQDNPQLEELRQLKKKIDVGYIREDTKALLTESRQGLERVKRIVLDLKNFSRAATEEQWAQADLNQGMEATLNVIWNELKYKCEVVKEYGQLPGIYCLPAQLGQVFLNLLVNAAQAIETRGKITIRTGQEGDRVWVEVSDTGKGIPPENIPHLFEPFFTTKPVGQGTGLGLSVSYSIVERHHGEIEVHSEVGKGSTFRVWLPVQQPANKKAV
ncbi:MAG: ATP-binding protein [Gallionella sp.]|nr:ATP-binding protein [Gallionella sp.]